MTTFKRFVSLLALVAALPLGASADPVETTETVAVERGKAACSVWVEPAGDEYEWTFVCGSAVDADGDGDVDSRSGVVFRDICQEEDPEMGSFCSGSEPIAEGDVGASDFAVDLPAGTGMLHADLGTCRLDVDWTAVADAETQSGSEVPRISPSLDLPSVYVWNEEREVTSTYRKASMTGTVCPAAEVSGAPRLSFLLEYEDTDRTTLVRIDPTR